MHKEHQRLVSDPQMDDLNVTLARPQRQSGKETLRIVRGGSFLCCHPQLLSPPFLLFISLSVFLSWLCLSDSLISLSYSHSFVLSPLSCLSFFLSIILFLSHTHRHTHRLLSFASSLMISTYGTEANSAVALNEKWQAIAAAHSHRYVDANNKTQRLDFTTGDFGLLF